MIPHPAILVSLWQSHTPAEFGALELAAISELDLKKLSEVHLIPLLVSGAMSIEAQDALYDLADGVYFAGGMDVNPTLYGQDPHPTTKSSDDKRDALELRILRKTLQDGKPFLGICRGSQMLAVAAGGTLIKHIPDITDEAHGVSIDTYDPVHPSSVWHDVLLKPGTKAAAIFQTDRINVPSRHHQAVDNPGSLIISGRSPAGIAEIIEHPDLPFHIGVQTHPELITSMDALYDAFRDAIKTFQKTKNA